MPGTLTVGLVTFVAAVVFVAGAINGIAGFGFALVGTLVLATVVDPATAVVFMIVPILSVNLSLVGDLSTSELRSCGRRFWPLILAALGGTVLGMLLLDWLPDEELRVGLGIVSLAFVVSAQQIVRIPGLERAKAGCFVETRPAMAGIGGLSGVLFGGTNVGVQFVAYVRSCDLPHGLFIGVIAMLFLGINSLRVVAAGALGLYPNAVVFGASVAAAVPAIAGVALGKFLRPRVTASQRRAVVLGLLTAIGVRLVLSGLAVA